MDVWEAALDRMKMAGEIKRKERENKVSELDHCFFKMNGSFVFRQSGYPTKEQIESLNEDECWSNDPSLCLIGRDYETLEPIRFSC
jgi:hypothetical protein